MNKTLASRALAAATMLTLLAGTGVAATSDDYSDSTSTVQAFADPETTLGESTLRRTADGVLATFQSTELSPNEAVTLWWVVFNQPENCSAPGCGEDDLFVGGDPAAGLDAEAIAAADIVAGFAAGTVAAADGSISMSSRLTAGESGTGVIFGDGALLKDAAVAEIHLVARSHGPAIEGEVVDQTTSYEGGCATMLNPPDVADDEGECVDIQYAVHQP